MKNTISEIFVEHVLGKSHFFNMTLPLVVHLTAKTQP